VFRVTNEVEDAVVAWVTGALELREKNFFSLLQNRSKIWKFEIGFVVGPQKLKFFKRNEIPINYE
jgi:hypothetical protein